MIEVHQITKNYQLGKAKFTALSDISLTIQPGEMVAIQGRSGAGKTTLFNILGCLDTMDSGTYRLDGQQVEKMKDAELAALRCKKIGFVLQEFALINQQSVLFNVMLPLFFDKMAYRTMKTRAMEALHKVGIANLARHKTNQLSGGQRQRVAIARALVNYPEIILADEPTGALDSKTAGQIMQLISELNQQGMTILLITHDDKMAAYCQRRIVIEDGKIIEDQLTQ
ncbi:ABC transporter ATP-binding protein [Saccharibacillus sp. CPCC 101409]|uniref:ABC transporter ATP-binding protein n=1 Tax=Saccharibacillus sp. CPCC 101409 TaxID=3058041 RepID=UPI002672FA34|nr:ABC transporter ATP-binding protein [Saccharibacillus sp. CPCC 101409]MDO3410374.1 ABC transporter ATP-binding protein [Saccharibacillus sp. CPCC 101409]